MFEKSRKILNLSYIFGRGDPQIQISLKRKNFAKSQTPANRGISNRIVINSQDTRRKFLTEYAQASAHTPSEKRTHIELYNECLPVREMATTTPPTSTPSSSWNGAGTGRKTREASHHSATRRHIIKEVVIDHRLPPVLKR